MLPREGSESPMRELDQSDLASRTSVNFTGAARQDRQAPQRATSSEPEAMAVRRLEMELEKVRLQLECERIALRRVELEQSGRPPSVSEGSDLRRASTDGISQCAKVLKAYRLPCDADVPIWFDEVEKLFLSFQVPEHSRVHLIMPALAERVRYLLRGLNDEECTDYETVKKAVLDELKLTPAKYLERFEKASKRKEETFAQFASRARTYLAYYLQSRNANTKEAMTELMVADRMKASLNSEALEYVLLREGEDWFKPVEVAKVLETFEQAKGKGRATKPAATASLPQHAKLAGPQRTNLKCHVCHIQGHLARDCPKASDKEPQGKAPTVPKQRVQKVAVVSEEPPPEQERVLSARVQVLAQYASSGRSKLDLIPIMCGGIATEAVLDTGSEITVVRKSMLPVVLQESSGTVRLESAFGNSVRANLATLPVGMHRPGASIQPQRIDLVCAVTDELAKGVDCLLSKEDWELLQAQEKEEFGRENILRLCARANPSMTEEERMRHLGRGLRPDVLEKILIANPDSCSAFLEILRRIDWAAFLMVRASQPEATGTYFSAGQQSCYPYTSAPAAGVTPAGATMQPPPTCLATCAAAERHCTREATDRDRDLRAIAASMASLFDRLKAIEEDVRRPAMPCPARSSCDDDERPRCQLCDRIGHIAPQCRQRFRENGPQWNEQRGGRDEQPGRPSEGDPPGRPFGSLAKN
nr:uncharacterized protein LOC126541986 [Dermacentor andersoni]